MKNAINWFEIPVTNYERANLSSINQSMQI